ncbi:hypothetical protein B9Z55_026416 [Caenorhabditis nigoni]|uniref:RING-type domain-containing protein n=1 Tax=Caenorhabditis nigoni TaxID=1611254 RepID=A0A2G5T3I1_9PELO|nr:hypothetical protein B9Z55_026416 [Caenorhabditis nigoni]
MFKVLENTDKERDRRIAHLQTDARLNQAVIEGLQEQANRDADVIDVFDKERTAYEASRLCSVCQEPYDSGDRTPHVLDCGLAVCRGCLESLVMPPQRPDLIPVLRCPICRTIVYADPSRNRPVYAIIPGALPIPPFFSK